jgi:hypothetical protein
MLTGAVWSDACILNISSRGLLIQSGRSTPQGSVVELRRGDQVIVARVVWRDGIRAGLRAEERLPVESILTLSQSASLRLTASSDRPVERRLDRRAHEESRHRARAFEFASIIVVSACLGATAFTMVEQALARPMAFVEAALKG